ncbi:MAG: hypothetical protein AAF495_17050 [Pseudomonadota bacterium]
MDDALGLGGLPLLSFDEEFYLAENPDVAAAIADGAFDGTAEDHYIEFGDREGRDPNALFDVAFYFLSNPDVAALVDIGAFETSLNHYETLGVIEERANLPLETLVFDSDFYLATNPDVLEAIVTGEFGEVARPGASAFAHFVFFGAAEGRSPNPLIPSPSAILELSRLGLLGESEGDFPSRADFIEGRAEVLGDVILPSFDLIFPAEPVDADFGFTFGSDGSGGTEGFFGFG